MLKEEETAIFHSEIIHEFFNRIRNETDSSCECGGVSELFMQELKHFTWLRKQFHHLRKFFKTSQHYSIGYVGGPAQAQIRYIELMNQLTASRTKLSRFAPCSVCIQTYNPTNRTNGKVWNPNRVRAFKEAVM